MNQYVSSEIAKLTASYNKAIAQLQSQLKSKINAINNMNIPIRNKNIMINSLRINYNNNVAKLTNDYNKKKQALLSMLTTTTPTKSALLIGINYINTSNQLSGCINDTKNMQVVLQNLFKYNTFTILTDETTNKPTKNNIINSLKDLLTNSKKGDNLFFLYSGHGSYIRDKNGDELDGRDELIVPLDSLTNSSNYIIDDELSKLIRDNLKEGVSLFMLMDSCFSGTVCDLKYNYLYNQNTQNVVNPNVTETIGNVFMISGCRDDQTSADAYINYNGANMSAGAMTTIFLQTINELGSNITLNQLLVTMREKLKQSGYSQIPQLSSGKSIDINVLKLSI